MGKSFVDHFASVSEGYADFRPVYPAPLFVWLAGVAPGRALAWDCATGTGQAARDLASHFERVVATDASRSQVETARAHERVKYHVASAEESGLAGGSVDLVTVAQALHWFDIDRFFGEAARVLKPGGVLAVWTYGPLSVQGPLVDAIIQRFYHEIVAPYWPAERALVDSGYRSIKFPPVLLETPTFGMTASWTLPELLGYLSTWSAVARYAEAVGHDPVALILGALRKVWGVPGVRREVVWPLTVKASRQSGRPA